MKKTGEILCAACWQESDRKLGISCKKLVELASSMFLPFYSTSLVKAIGKILRGKEETTKKCLKKWNKED